MKRAMIERTLIQKVALIQMAGGPVMEIRKKAI
jgi:hypothetical protein